MDLRLLSGLFAQLSMIFRSARFASIRETRRSWSGFQARPSNAHSSPVRGHPSPKRPVSAGFMSASICGVRRLQIFFENPKKLFWCRFSVKGKIILLGEESVRGERGQQPAYQKVNHSPDSDAEALAEESVAMNGQHDERFTDAFAQGT